MTDVKTAVVDFRPWQRIQVNKVDPTSEEALDYWRKEEILSLLNLESLGGKRKCRVDKWQNNELLSNLR